MNHTDSTAPSAYTAPAPATCAYVKSELLNELGRIYLEAGLPLGAAFEAALADVLFFDFRCPAQT